MTIGKEQKNGNGLSDVTKAGLPLPTLFVLGSALIGGLGAFYGLSAKQAQLEMSITYERRINDQQTEATRRLDEVRNQLTEKQIEISGLRNSAMVLSAENNRLNALCSAVAKGR